MSENLRQEQHMVEKDRICPSCGMKGAINFWRKDGTQSTLNGKYYEGWIRCLPYCSSCQKTFDEKTKFQEVR